jgi:hypothetical protein
MEDEAMKWRPSEEVRITMWTISVVFGVVVLLGWLLFEPTATCFKSPMGGTPVDIRERAGELFVCAELSDGTFCKKMVPCQ